MKLSGYHKRSGDDVIFKTEYNDLESFDRVYISKVFTDTPIDDSILKKPNVKYGGTGFFFDKAPPLDYVIEHGMPDYHLYDNWVQKKIDSGGKASEFTFYKDYSIGFMTRGCIRQCKFCVNQNYKKCNLHSHVSEFLDPERKKICLWDDNVFACADWESVFHELQSTGKPFTFRQGLDERLLTDEKCIELFQRSKWTGDYIFAFDNIRDTPTIKKKLDLIRKYTNKVVKFYVFCGFNHDEPYHYDQEFWDNDVADMFERIRILSEYSCLPYIMRFADYEKSSWRGIYINAARWCNQPSFFKKLSFREFCGKHNAGSATMKYLEEFESARPDIAKKYFDNKFTDVKEAKRNIA